MNVELGSAIAARMQVVLTPRGPDGGGAWSDPEAGLFFAHRRLAVIDPGPSGTQPMISASGRFVLICNGEIYNHLELRRSLEQRGAIGGWRGLSDSETLLAAIEAWGLVPALQRVIGMFALALWDRQARRLFMARDRMGEKPLYYGWQTGGDRKCFLFASEPGALERHPSFTARIDRSAFNGFARHGYVGGERSIWEGIAKLAPGTVLSLAGAGGEPELQTYWSFASMVATARSRPFAGSLDDAAAQLDSLLGAAVKRQMLSDVPLGALLSGGIDSTAIAMQMSASSSSPLKTFTVGFDDPAWDESGPARAVASHLGSDHHELRISPAEAMAIIPQLPTLYSEPFADSSQIPTYLVSCFAREQITVALTGDGGDEVFGGYNRYAAAAAHWQRISAWPLVLRRPVSRLAGRVPPGMWHRLGRGAGERHWRLFADKARKAGLALGARTVMDLHRILASVEPNPQSWVCRGEEAPSLFDTPPAELAGLDPVEQMMAIDSLTYLPGDILVKVDRAAMGAGLETRAPFLDPDVMGFAWSLPLAMKLGEGRSKRVLRQMVERQVPRALIERPKAGFGVPVGDWLRGPMRDWAEDLLNPADLAQRGYWQAGTVRRAWHRHLSGREDNVARLWPVLMFQAWLNRPVGREGERV